MPTGHEIISTRAGGRARLAHLTKLLAREQGARRVYAADAVSIAVEEAIARRERGEQGKKAREVRPGA
jgi:hypothetical protein